MKFKIGDKIYNLSFLTANDNGDWRLRYTETEGLVLTSPEEIDVLERGEPTGIKTIQWVDALTYATGEDARLLWETIKRVMVSEGMLMDVDKFMQNVGAHDEAVDAAREAMIEEQRIKAAQTRETTAKVRGLSLWQIRAMNSGPDGRGPMLVPPPVGGVS